LIVTSHIISPAYTDTGVCGAGYHQIDHHALPDATIYLDYNGSQNCVVTIKTKNVGTPTYTEAWLFRQSDGSGADDHGNFGYYAGPVYILGQRLVPLRINRPMCAGGRIDLGWRGGQFLPATPA